MAVITISRQFGAGGRTLGTEVAEKLNYTFVDEEMVEKVAEEANVSTNWVKSVEKEAGGWLLRFISGMGPFKKKGSYTADDAKPKKRGYIDGHIYVELLQKVMPRLADEDNVVIIGRGGQYILADHPKACHFLAVANLEHRIQFMVKNYNLSRKQSEIVVEKQGKRRLNLYRYFGREDYDQPDLYHLVLNMDKLTMEKAVETVCHFVS